MDQTAQQIVAHIDTTRERLGSNLDELERKVEAVTDWREHFQARPFTLLGMAFAGGVVVAATLRSRPSRPSNDFARPAPAFQSPTASESQKHQALDTLHNIKGALIGVALERFKNYVAAFIPGFEEQFRRTQVGGPSFRASRDSAPPAESPAHAR